MAGTQEPGTDKNVGGPGKPGRTPRRERGQANNGFWYLLAIGVLAAVFYSVAVRGRSGEKVGYSDFLERVAAGALNKDEMFEVVVTPSVITWQDESREDLSRGSKSSFNRFYVPLIGLDDRKVLFELFKTHHIKFGLAEMPSEWTTLIPMLVFTVLLIGAFFFLLKRIGGAGFGDVIRA